jgi:hypothetical protein
VAAEKAVGDKLKLDIKAAEQTAETEKAAAKKFACGIRGCRSESESDACK